jgi:hypothetical protein
MALLHQHNILLTVLILGSAIGLSACACASETSDPLPSTLSVTTEPRAAKVYVDGRFYGMTPVELEMEPGTRLVRILREGYMIEQRSVILKPGARAEVSVTLEPAGILEIDSVPGGADLLVDGDIVAVTPAEVPVRPGLRRIEVSKKGHEPWVREIRMEAGEKQRFQPELEYRYGRLEIVSTPKGADVYLNDELRGKASPLVLEEIPPGLYRFRMALPTFEDKLGEVMVERGETVSVVERLQHTFEYLEAERKHREARNNVIRKSVRFSTLAVGIVSAFYASTLNEKVKDQESLYNSTAYTEQASQFRENVRDWEAKRNLWGGVATLSLSVGLLTFVF